jgi:hypothetical protein
MTEEQINIAIAEACGYEKHEEFYRWRDPQTKELLCWKSLPDYCNDLNAMHEAEKVFTYEEAEQFEDELCNICDMENRHKEYPLPFRFAVAHATSRQRAEAFLRTIDKWKEARSE